MTVSIKDAKALADTLTVANSATLTRSYSAFAQAKQFADTIGMEFPRGMFSRTHLISEDLIQEMRTTTDQAILDDIIKDISYDSIMS